MMSNFRRLGILCGLAAVACSGCIGLSIKGNQLPRRHQAVVVDGQIYVVDTKSGKVTSVTQRVPDCSANPAEPPPLPPETPIVD